MAEPAALVKPGLNGAVAGAAAIVMLGLVLALTALFTGGHVSLPGLIVATGGTTNGASSVEFTIGWTVLATAAILGAGLGMLLVRRRAPDGKNHP